MGIYQVLCGKGSRKGMAMAEKVELWMAWPKGHKNGQNKRKARGTRSGEPKQQNFKSEKKPRWGKKNLEYAIQGKGISQVVRESSSSYITMVTMGAGTQGNEGKKRGRA